MAIKKRTPENESSIFKKAIIAAPIAIGAGMGISRFNKRSTNFGNPINPVSPLSESIDQVNRFANRYVSKAHSGTYKDWQLDKLAGFSQNVSVPLEQLKASWQRATSHADPTRQIFQATESRLSIATTPQQFISDLQIIGKQNSSFAMQKTLNAFLDDLGVLNKRASGGLRLHTTSLPMDKYSLYKGQSISLGQLNQRMREDLLKAQSIIGGDLSIKRFSREGFEGSFLKVSFGSEAAPTNLPLGTFDLTIHEGLKSNKAIIATGAGLQSKRIAGYYGIVEQGRLQKAFTHEQFVSNRFLEELIPSMMNAKRQSRSSLKSMLKDFELKMIQDPEWIPTLSPGAHEALDKYAQTRSQIVRLFTPNAPGSSSIRPINSIEQSDILLAGGLKLKSGKLKSVFPAASPTQVQHGVMSYTDTRSMMSFVPEAVPFERRPLQPLRSNFVATDDARRFMSISPLESRFAWAKHKGYTDSPIVRAAYVSSSRDPEFAKYGFHSEGQIAISEQLSGKRGVKELGQLDIASSSLVDAESLLGEDLSKSKWSINKAVQKGTFLGYDPEGRPVELSEDMKILEAYRYPNTKSKGDYIRFVTEKEIASTSVSKVYLGGKGMAKEVPQSLIDRILSQEAAPGAMGLGELNKIDALITMDELKKNRGLHYDQMFSALWEFSKQNMDSGKATSIGPKSQAFINDPLNAIEQMRQGSIKGNILQHDNLLKDIFGIARESNLSPSQMGSVFGAVPEVYGKDWATRIGATVTEEELKFINQGVARGATQLMYAGMGGSGAGNIGSVEPRLFELLESPHLGKTGKAISDEILHRLSMANPEKIMEQELLAKSVASFASRASDIAGVLPSSLSGQVPMKDTILNLKDFGNVYLPGSENIPQLRPYLTPEGNLTTPDLAKSYESFIESATKYEQGGLSYQRMQEEITKMQSSLGEARVTSVTGTGGLARNKLAGSRYLTAMTGDVGLDEAGITKPYMQKMVDDLSRQGILPSSDLANMQKNLEQGGIEEGVVFRHPFIGPYSAQPIKLKLIQGDEAIAVFNQQYLKGRVTINGVTEELSNPIRLSPMIGLSADTDGDTVGVMLGGGNLKPQLKEYLKDPQATQAYQQYSIRSQLLKAKAPGSSEITIAEAVAGAPVKMGVTTGGQLGRISNQLQKGKSAILEGFGSMTEGERANAMGLLEWMEQTPISGKHIKPGREREMVSLLDDINEAFTKKNASSIAGTARSVLANASTAAHAGLQKGFDIELSDQAGQIVSNMHIPGIDIDKASQNISNAMAQMESSGAGRMRGLMMGKATPTAEEAASMLNTAQMKYHPLSGLFSNSVDVLGTKGNVVKNTFRQASEATMASINKMAAAGRSMIPFAKPLAIGTGVALGIAAVLSNPPSSLEPGDLSPPTPNLRSGTGGSTMGETPVPQHTSTNVRDLPPPNLTSTRNTARIGSGRPYRKNRIRISANSSSDSNYSAVIDQLSKTNRVRGSISDHRSTLTKRSIEDMLSNS